MKSRLRVEVRTLWEVEWSTRVPSTITSFFPILRDLTAATKTIDFAYVKRLITGHCALSASLHRFDSSVSPLCECGCSAETVDHFVFECPRFDGERLPLIDSCMSPLGSWPPRTEALCQHADVWAAFTDFVKCTGRLASGRRTGARSRTNV